MKFRTLLSAGVFPCVAAAMLPGAARAADAIDPDARPGRTIVVTTTRSELELRDAPASVSVVAGKTLRRRPVQDLAEALENEPGIVINGIGMTRRGISIRGMSNEHVLTLVDGRRINEAASNMAHVDFDLGWVPSIAIEQVELVRGPLSALYGSEALAGVVNVRTRRPETFEVSALALGSVQEGAGGNSAQLSALVGGPVTDTLGVVAWGEYRRRDRTQYRDDDRQSQLEQRDAISGSIIAYWEPVVGQRFEVGQAAIDDDRARDTLTSGRSPVYYEYQDHISRGQTHGTYNGAFGWGDVQVRAYRSVLKRVNERDQDQSETPTTKAVDFVADAQVTVKPFAGNRLTLGAEHRNEWLRDATINAQGEDSVNHDAIFAQDEWSFLPFATLTFGGRFDHHDNFGWEFSPRGYLVLEPVAGLKLRGGVGEAFKAPSLKQLSPGYAASAAGGRFTIYGNPDLDPETSTSYELGATYYGTSWELGATLFQNDVRNLIATQCYVSCGVRGQEERTYYNINKARIRGVEMSGQVRPFEALTVSASYTYVEPHDVTQDREIEERPNHTAKVQVSWDAAPGTRFQARGRYIGKQTLYDDEAVRLPDYMLWGIDASHRLVDGITLKAGVENLFDKSMGGTTTSYSYAVRGRTVFLGIGADF